MTNMGGCKKIKKEVEGRERDGERGWGGGGGDFLLVRSNLAAAQAPIFKSH